MSRENVTEIKIEEKHKPRLIIYFYMAEKKLLPPCDTSWITSSAKHKLDLSPMYPGQVSKKLHSIESSHKMGEVLAVQAESVDRVTRRHDLTKRKR